MSVEFSVDEKSVKEFFDALDGEILLANIDLMIEAKNAPSESGDADSAQKKFSLDK